MKKHARILLAIGALLALGGGEAIAVIGRPLTPMSYAGVARRTARRSYYYGAGGYYGAGAAAVATVATLPGGCVMGGGIYTCGAYRYRPYYDGPTVVYQRVY